jgi:hypothetical protein
MHLVAPVPARRVLVSGGRTYDKREILFSRMSILHQANAFELVIVGGASGADKLGEVWARENNVRVRLFLPRWHVHGLMAGPARNGRMLDEGRPDLVLIFPGGIGTADLTRRAHERRDRYPHMTVIEFKE